jgi:hypothetical protein
MPVVRTILDLAYGYLLGESGLSHCGVILERMAERGGFSLALITKDFGSSRFRVLPISHRFWENSLPET